VAMRRALGKVKYHYYCRHLTNKGAKTAQRITVEIMTARDIIYFTQYCIDITKCAG